MNAVNSLLRNVTTASLAPWQKMTLMNAATSTSGLSLPVLALSWGALSRDRPEPLPVQRSARCWSRWSGESGPSYRKAHSNARLMCSFPPSTPGFP